MHIALTDSFARKLARLLKRHSELRKQKVFDKIFEQLSKDAFSPKL